MIKYWYYGRPSVKYFIGNVSLNLCNLAEEVLLSLSFTEKEDIFIKWQLFLSIVTAMA